jgi:hypothetical protein
MNKKNLETKRSNLKAWLQVELESLIKEIKDNGFIVKCVWVDEYGGEQSIVLGNSDSIKIIDE